MGLLAGATLSSTALVAYGPAVQAPGVCGRHRARADSSGLPPTVLAMTGHLNGPMPTALIARVGTHIAEPTIEKLEVLAAKLEVEIEIPV